MIYGKKSKLIRIEKENILQLWNWHEENELTILREYDFSYTIDGLYEIFKSNFYKKITFFIKIKKEKYIGICSYSNVNWKNRCCDLSLQVCEPDIDQSISIDALSAIASFLFFDLNMKNIQAISREKDDEIQLYESVGFRKEGRLREHYFRGGRFGDSNVYSLGVAEFTGEGDGNN